MNEAVHFLKYWSDSTNKDTEEIMFIWVIWHI